MFFGFFCSEATAAAALKGQVAWSNAMEGATKVRDAYSRRSHELSQASCVCVFFWGAGGVGRLNASCLWFRKKKERNHPTRCVFFLPVGNNSYLGPVELWFHGGFC